MKSLQKGSTHMIITIIVLVIGLIAGYFWFNGSKEDVVDDTLPDDTVAIPDVNISTSTTDVEPDIDLDPEPVPEPEPEPQAFVPIIDPDPEPSFPVSNGDVAGDPDTTEDLPIETFGACGFFVESITAEDDASFPLTLSGGVYNDDLEAECLWDMFEGQAGMAQLYFYDVNDEESDEEDRWISLGTSTPILVEDWEAATTTFTTTVDFDNEFIGLENGNPVRVVFTEENNSEGEIESDTFTLPLVLNQNLAEPHDCGFRVTSISPDDIVNFPATIIGDINNSEQASGCTWEMFEGSGGVAQLYYQSGEDLNILGTSTPIIVDDWTATSTTFTTTIDFNNEGIGLPLGTELLVIFTEDSDDEFQNPDVFEIPIVLGASSEESE